MSRESSSRIKPTRSRRSVSTYDNDIITEADGGTPLIHRPVKRSKKVSICTFCGRYEGLRLVPKSSLPYFYLWEEKDTLTSYTHDK